VIYKKIFWTQKHELKDKKTTGTNLMSLSLSEVNEATRSMTVPMYRASLLGSLTNISLIVFSEFSRKEAL